MGNARSKSASRPRPSEKSLYLFQKNGKYSHEFPSLSPRPSFSQKKLPTTSTIIIENSNINKKNQKFIHELNESIRTCTEIVNINSLIVPNCLFTQNSSLLYNPEKLNNKKENLLVFDFFLNSEKAMKILKTPRNSKKQKDPADLAKSNSDMGSDLKKLNNNQTSGSFIKEGTPKVHNTRDLSSPKEDGSTPHFDKKSDFSQNSQTKLEITQNAEVEKTPLNMKDYAISKQDYNVANNPKENQVSLKEKLSHILKSNLNKSINSDNSLKFSGILDALDEEPHHIHLNLEDFLKGGIENDKNTNNNNLLSRANLEKLNTMNNKNLSDKRNVLKNSSLPKKHKIMNANNTINNSKRNIITNGLNNSKSGNLKEDQTIQPRNKFLQNMATTMMKNKENEGNAKKYVSLKKYAAGNENMFKLKKKN